MMNVDIDFMAFIFDICSNKLIEIEYFVNLFTAVPTKGLYQEAGISIARKGVQVC
jgi:hypothetical protein